MLSSSIHFRLAPRFVRWFLTLVALFPAVSAGAAQLATPMPTVGNATPADLVAIQDLFTRLDRGVAQRDAATLTLFGLNNIPPQITELALQSQISHVAVTPAGALVRHTYQVLGQGAHTPQKSVAVLKSATHEFWLARTDAGAFTFSNQRWQQPLDPAQALAEVAVRDASTAASTGAGATGRTGQAAPTMLDLVAERRGGRWIPLRRTPWTGALLSPKNVARFEAGQGPYGFRWQGDNKADIAEWLRREMERQPLGRTGTGHFFLQRGTRGWIGVGASWDADRNIHPDFDNAAQLWRQYMLVNYARPDVHRDFGNALARVGLFIEAAQEMQKAERLQPGIVGEARLREVLASQTRDPQLVVLRQLDSEMQVGRYGDRPEVVIQSLALMHRKEPTPLSALRLALECSKVADDEAASRWLKAGEEMVERGDLDKLPDADAAWVDILLEHLRSRRTQLGMKPPNVIRSSLFTVRCTQDDMNALHLLGALEAAQHTVYAGFMIPMGTTEVLLWPNQTSFQQYTSLFSAQGNSEFVAALTLTKLIATHNGPMVLGEEINVFIDQRSNVYSTVAHEYGHVAVREMSKGRLVPVWFNEGIAAMVEGGYDGYIDRVRNARQTRTLIGYRDLQAWDLEDERAFLAYSQANSIVDYIVARWGSTALLDILREIGRDTAPDDAFDKVLKISPQELWKVWAQNGIR